MSTIRVPIQSLNGGVSRRESSKRLPQEVENADNVLLTVERSAEKRPPLTHIKTNMEGDFLNMPNVVAGAGFNPDHLYFHFIDVDGINRYCIVINRAVTETNLMVRVFRIEPTEWIEEEFDRLSFDRGMKEYLMHYNLSSDSSLPIPDIMGSITFGNGAIFWNKQKKLSFLPDNSDKVKLSCDIAPPGSNCVEGFYEPDPSFIHSGDKIRYKTADMNFVDSQGNPANGGTGMVRLPGANEEDKEAVPYEPSKDSDNLYSKWISYVADAVNGGGYKNVIDDIESRVNSVSLETYSVGHNVANFSEVPIPPAVNDLGSHNGWKARAMMQHLYHRNENGISGSINDAGYLTSPFKNITGEGSIYTYETADTTGKGEIWYARDPYFSFTSGFYRTVSNSESGQPYFQKVRAEDKDSVIDHRTFPVLIKKEKDGVWRISYCPLIPKATGTSINNPGPSAIKENETIKAMEFWKGRLWIATDTTIFASRVNEFFNYFLEDVMNITDADPIDLSVNTGQFNRVQSLTSFQNFLFITTRSGNQFEIRGSATDAGNVSPTSIELRSTSFYSTASTANPVKMGASIYFFDKEKLFLYSGSDAFGNEYSTAYELSTHCRGYLPENYQVVTAIPSYNSLVMVDRDQKNHMYVYTMKTNGQQLVQNAFYRWELDENDQILAIQGYETGFYVVVKRSNGLGQRLYAYYGTFEPVTLATPLLDRLVKVESNKITYDMETNTTTIRLPYYDPNAKEIVLADNWSESRRYIRYVATGINSAQYDGHQLTELIVTGNLASERAANGTYQARRVWAGRPYEMNIQLSPLHVRDQENTARPGVLNLKRMTTRHRNTAQYTLEIQRYNRAKSSVRSEAFSFNDTTDLLGMLRIEKEGELLSKILGYADSTSIFIKSNFPTPCNITTIEVIGNFRPGDTSIQK
jgi:hypothetical protein